MILLDGHTLTPKVHFVPESMPMTLVDQGISTASITLGPDAPALRVDDWLLDTKDPGAGIVWRVKALDTVYDTKTRTAQLEHVIATLKDELLFGEITTRAIAGGSASTVQAQKAARYVLGRQRIWALGDFEFSRALPYSFNNQTVFAALETICGTLEDWRWEYDLSSLPFKLHIRKKRDGIGCELRSARNLLTLRKTVDRSNMYTRFYPVGARNIHISGNYVSRNEGLYGVVSKTETDQSISDRHMLKAWAEDRLSRHCEPLVTITISALELSAATGEALDRLRLGYICRVPLPEFGTTIKERITKINWADKLREPERATVTLANQLNDVANIIRQISSSGSRNSGGGAKAAEEDHAWIVDTADHVGLVAEAVAGEGAAEDWSRVASIMVDGQGIHQRVVTTEEGIVSLWSSIEVLDTKIELEVASAKSDTYSKITQTASSIRTEVSSSKSAIYSNITQTANSIRTEVANAKSDTYSKIVQTASSIRTEVSGSKSTIYSTIMQTRTSIYTQVANAKSDTYSKIEQTASSIRSEINSSKSSIWSSITQTSTAISLKVSKNGVISSINQTAEEIRIKASKINLDGYVTVSDLNTTNAKIDNLKSGDTTASFLKANSMSANHFTVNSGGSFTFRSYTVSWKLASFKNGDGGTTEFYYLGR